MFKNFAELWKKRQFFSNINYTKMYEENKKSTLAGKILSRYRKNTGKMVEVQGINVKRIKMIACNPTKL